MIQRHMVYTGNITPFSITSLMQGNPFQLIEDLDIIGVIIDYYFFTNILVGDAVLISVFGHHNVVIHFYGSYYFVTDDKGCWWQGIQELFLQLHESVAHMPWNMWHL